MNQGKTLLLLLSALLIASLLTAQTARITGKIWNAEANTPLAGASVLLTEAPGPAGSTGSATPAGSTAPRKGTSSDVEGRFFLAAIKGHTYTLTVSGVGFVTRTMEKITVGDEPVSIDIIMESSRK